MNDENSPLNQQRIFLLINIEITCTINQQWFEMVLPIPYFKEKSKERKA
jgi:hypothetical protein